MQILFLKKIVKIFFEKNLQKKYCINFFFDVKCK